MKKRAFSPGLPGVSALITVFAVLCIAVFAVLALSTSLSDERLTDAAVAHSEEYYRAEAQAEERLAEARAQGETGELSFQVPISDTLSLCVGAQLGVDGKYEILQWQQVYTADWSADESLDVWLGD